MAWKWSTHSNNSAGIDVHCVDCHLPRKEKIIRYSFHKAKHGIKDAYGFYFKDSSDIDWTAKSSPEIAAGFVYKESCLKCHTNLFPLTLSDQGSDAHLRYEADGGKKRCISCHISVGHFDPLANSSNIGFGSDALWDTIYLHPAVVKDFSEYTEQIPGTSVTFSMDPVPGGTFIMGSVQGTPFRQRDEVPARQVQVDSFWMGEIEVSWDEYLAFFQATSSQGRKEGLDSDELEVDGISGPTPPWGAPDQGW